MQPDLSDVPVALIGFFSMPALLDEEVQTYETRKPELLGNSEGKFVLIKGGEVAGIYESETDAITDGYNRFGNVPFLVRQILRVEPTQNFITNNLAL